MNASTTGARTFAYRDFHSYPKYEHEFDDLASATAAAMRFKLDYPGDYCSRVGIYPLPEGKYLVLGHWHPLGD